MSCKELPGVILCSPDSVTVRRVVRCPTCKTRRRFVVDLFVWYDPIGTCCACGDSFSAGERMMRPAKRGWRTEATKRAKAKWRSADNESAYERMHALVREAVEA